MLLPALSSAKRKAQQIACMNNFKQLTLGWIMYAGDNQDRLVSNDRWTANSYVFAAAPPVPPAVSDYWCPGRMDAPASAVNAGFIKAGTLYPAINSVAAYHCPSDPTQLLFAGSQQNRVRSYSMSTFMMGNDAEVLGLSGSASYQNNHKLTNIKKPTDAIVFCEEGPSMDDGCFGVNPVLTSQGGTTHWQNVPAFYHGTSTAFSFADGHAELHHWTEGGTLVKAFVNLTYATSIGVADPTTSHQDLDWVKQHLSTP